MADDAQELEARFIKLTLSSIMKTIEALHDDIDAHETVRQHMLAICAGVRERTLAATSDDMPPEQTTAGVDALIQMIDEYIDYSASPMFGDIHLVRRKPS